MAIEAAGIEPALVARRPARTIISIQLHFNFYLDPFHRGPPHRPPGEELCQVEICPKAISETGLEPVNLLTIVRPLQPTRFSECFLRKVGEAGFEPATEYSAMGFTICLLPDLLSQIN